MAQPVSQARLIFPLPTDPHAIWHDVNTLLWTHSVVHLITLQTSENIQIHRGTSFPGGEYSKAYQRLLQEKLNAFDKMQPNV